MASGVAAGKERERRRGGSEWSRGRERRPREGEGRAALSIQREMCVLGQGGPRYTDKKMTEVLVELLELKNQAFEKKRKLLPPASAASTALNGVLLEHHPLTVDASSATTASSVQSRPGGATECVLLRREDVVSGPEHRRFHGDAKRVSSPASPPYNQSDARGGRKKVEEGRA